MIFPAIRTRRVYRRYERVVQLLDGLVLSDTNPTPTERPDKAEKLINKKLPSRIIEGFEPDPSLKAEPIQRGRSGNGGGNRNGGQRTPKSAPKRDTRGEKHPKKEGERRR